jgi:hypothetical protein
LRDWMIVPRFGEVRQSHTAGRCAKCATSDPKRRVIGTGIYIDGDGINASRSGEIQLCDECVKAAARLIGMIAPERADALAVSERDANLAKGRLEKRIAKLETAIAALRELDSE